MYDKIVLPTDGSGYAEQVADRVTKLISDGGEIIVVSVAGKLTSSAFQSRKNVKKVNAGLKKEAEDAVEHMVSILDDNLNVKKVVKTGFPAEEINDLAEKENADIIVISASGKSGLHKFIIGSVAEEVLKNSNIDVLLVHNK